MSLHGGMDVIPGGVDIFADGRGFFTGCRGHFTCDCGYLNMCSWIFSQVVLDVGTDAVCLVFNWFDTTMYKDCSHYLRKR